MQNLKFYRKQNNFSQAKLAMFCSVSTNYITEMEMGRKFPSADTLEKLCIALAVSPSGLFLENPSFPDINNLDAINYNNVFSNTNVNFTANEKQNNNNSSYDIDIDELDSKDRQYFKDDSQTEKVRPSLLKSKKSDF